MATLFQSWNNVDKHTFAQLSFLTKYQCQNNVYDQRCFNVDSTFMCLVAKLQTFQSFLIMKIYFGGRFFFFFFWKIKESSVIFTDHQCSYIWILEKNSKGIKIKSKNKVHLPLQNWATILVSFDFEGFFRRPSPKLSILDMI